MERSFRSIVCPAGSRFVPTRRASRAKPHTSSTSKGIPLVHSAVAPESYRPPGALFPRGCPRALPGGILIFTRAGHELGFSRATLMKLITWNCRVGGFRWKSERIAPLLPDVLAVQEVENLDSLVKFSGPIQPTFRDRITDPAFPRRAIGVFSYTGVAARAVDLSEPMNYFRRYEVDREGLSFNVVAVWTYKTKVSKTSYRQVHEGLIRHASWIRERPTVILGDFNANASFKGKNWRELVELLSSFGLSSAYHRYFDEEPGSESRPTHFHGGKEASPFHLDYCFLPEDWVSRIKRVEVGAHNDWCALSDHVPLVVDLDLESP